MDNNNINQNQSSDSFYSYSNTQNNGYGAGSQQNSFGAGNQSGYGSGVAGSQTGYGYGAAGSQQNGYGAGSQINYGYGATERQQNSGYQQSGGYGSYQQNGSYQQGGGANQTPKKEKKKWVRKPGSFGTKLAKCAALALVFGLVAGTAFEGVRLVSGNLFGDTEQQQVTEESVLTQSEGGGRVETTNTSSNYVATDVSDIVEAVMPSIVAITNISETEYRSFWGGRPQTYESTSAGSGILVSQDENNLYIVTNNHVVEGATTLTVTFNDNSTVSAMVKGTDPSTDLAVITVSLDSIEEETMEVIKVATLGNSDELKVGQASIAIGNALGYGQSVTMGCISALNREVSVSDSMSGTNYTAELIQTDAAINPGNSGGALLNATGEVIGINSVKYADTDVEGIGYAIPISTAMPIIEDLITKEKVDEADSAFLGIAGVDVTDDVSATYGMPEGVYVAQVTAGSAAEKAGIKKGDIITAFDGKEISSMEELSTRLQYYKAGTTVDVTLKRASEGEFVEQTISVTLGKKN